MKQAVSRRLVLNCWNVFIRRPQPNRGGRIKLAAVRYEAGSGPATDALLTELARRLKRAGYKLAGAVQSNTPATGRSRCDMTLEDLASGLCVKASEDRGPLAGGCRLDAGALEEIAGLFNTRRDTLRVMCSSAYEAYWAAANRASGLEEAARACAT